MTATAAQPQVTQQRNVFHTGQLMTAGGATRARHEQVVAGRVWWRLIIFHRHEVFSFMLHHQRHAMDDDIQEAANHQPDDSPHQHGIRAAGRGYENRQHGKQSIIHQTTEPSLKIGIYMAITSPPISTPSITMMRGSSSEDSAATSASTSSS